VTLYLSIEQVLEVHAYQIRRFKGSAGLRDRGALEAAVARPQMTFGGEDLYPEIPAKAAALMHSLVMNHPFVDGNKRVGAHAALLFIGANRMLPEITPAELTEATLSLARGEFSVEALTVWLRQRVRRREP
jgi:death-on-curing protein